MRVPKKSARPGKKRHIKLIEYLVVVKCWANAGEFNTGTEVCDCEYLPVSGDELGMEWRSESSLQT
jgi:hypothetical protein